MRSSLGVDLKKTEAFRALLERFCELARCEGLILRPFQGTEAQYFSRLDEFEQRRVAGNFQAYVSVCESVVADGDSLLDDNHFLWRMFQKLGVHPASDLMSTIENGDIIEIYNSEFVQIFRNLGFFSRCSYTLDELLCRPFWQLFRRDDSVTEKIIGVGKTVFGGNISGIHRWGIGVHTVDEIDSPAKYHSVIENKIISPLYDSSGNVVAAVNTIRSISCVRTLPELDLRV